MNENKLKEEKLMGELFLKLMKKKSPEYAIGVLESIKLTYYMVAWDKQRK